MRIPAKIKSFYWIKGFSKSEFLEILNANIEKSLNLISNPGILLSGGIDSSLLAILATKYYPDIPCFVVGNDIEHPDVQAAEKLAKEKGLNLKVRIFNKEEIIILKQEQKKCAGSSHVYEGDDCVFGALKFVAENDVTGIIATDGIDELMGGYWGHRDRKRFPDVKDAFKYFWDELEEKHLSPMYKSAKFFELDLIFIYLLRTSIAYLSLIPLKDRIKDNIGKAVWREIAQEVGVPQWIIDRTKEGFLNAFNK